jgi:hypothetical protein
MDDFLEEQLERMRRLTERMSQMHRRVTENSELISRDRDALYSGPLYEVRDFRTHQTYDYSVRREGRRQAVTPERSVARDMPSRKKRR